MADLSVFRMPGSNTVDYVDAISAREWSKAFLGVFPNRIEVNPSIITRDF
jgi:hypothetical protein